MHPVDWSVLIAFVAWIVYDGLKRTKDSHYARRLFPRQAQHSLVGRRPVRHGDAAQRDHHDRHDRPGLHGRDAVHPVLFRPAARDDHPVADARAVFLPVRRLHGLRVSGTALRRRRRGSFTSLLFLISRGMSCGAVVSAPAVVLSLILGWDLTLTALAITVPAVIYTMWGGVQAVTWTDVKIMAPDRLRPVCGHHHGDCRVSRRCRHAGRTSRIAAVAGRLRTFDFSFDLTNQYTFWSGTIAALFLFCSYFGTDQSQVQRFLTARSVDEARHSLLMSAYWKIPLQALVLLLGIFVFVFYIFNQPPLLFSSVQQERLRASPRAAEYASLQAEFEGVFAERAAGGGRGGGGPGRGRRRTRPWRPRGRSARAKRRCSGCAARPRRW